LTFKAQQKAYGIEHRAKQDKNHEKRVTNHMGNYGETKRFLERMDSSLRNFSSAFVRIHFENRDQQFSLLQWLVSSFPSSFIA